jgi:flagellar biogenesis protein FliO
MIGRMLLALVVVLGLMWALARWAKKPLTGKADRVMAVLARQQLNRNSSVTVLRVMDRALVLGITEQGIRLLGETDLSAVEGALSIEDSPTRGVAGLLRSRPATPKSLPPAQPDSIYTLDANDAEPPFYQQLPPAAPAAAEPTRRGALDGSVLSPNTWRQLVGAARDLTVRR